MKKGWQLNSCMSLSITVTVDEISMSITVISQNVGDAEYRNTGAFHYPAWTFRIYRPLLRYTEPYQMERKAGEAEPPGLFQTVSEWSSWYGHHNASDVYPGRSSLITACFFSKGLGIPGQEPVHSCGDILVYFPRSRSLLQTAAFSGQSRPY